MDQFNVSLNAFMLCLGSIRPGWVASNLGDFQVHNLLVGQIWINCFYGQVSRGLRRILEQVIDWIIVAILS